MAIIFEQATSGQSQRFNVRGSSMPTSVFASFGAGDTADLQFSQDGGTTWIDAYIGGDQQSMSGTGNVLYVDQPGVYRMDVTNASGGSVKLTIETGDGR